MTNTRSPSTAHAAHGRLGNPAAVPAPARRTTAPGHRPRRPADVLVAD